MPMTVKRRGLLDREVGGTTTTINKTSGAVSTTNSYVKGNGAQITASEGHPVKLIGKTLDDIGGNFTTRKIWNSFDEGNHHSFVFRNTSVSEQYYDGCFFATAPKVLPEYLSFDDISDDWPDYSSSDEDLYELGATAVARCKPTNDIASVSTALGELMREGLPTVTGLQMRKDKLDLTKGPAGEYLNYQFGILPLLNDVKDFHKALTKNREILDQFNRDNGRLVRRSYSFPESRETLAPVSHDRPFGWPTLITNAYSTLGTPGTPVKTTEIVKNRWFDGAFIYHLPEGDTPLGRMYKWLLEAEKLFGVAPDPEDLWNLTPWSWAIDWAVNVGDLISNLTDRAQYGLVMPYGYIMETTSVTYTYTTSGVLLKNGASAAPMVIKDVTKKRVAASPYGFGLTWDGFNTYQLSILAALGLTRRR